MHPSYLAGLETIKLPLTAQVAMYLDELLQIMAGAFKVGWQASACRPVHAGMTTAIQQCACCVSRLGCLQSEYGSCM